MSDLDSYVTHCYDLLLKTHAGKAKEDDSELCACAALVHQHDNH